MIYYKAFKENNYPKEQQLRNFILKVIAVLYIQF